MSRLKIFAIVLLCIPVVALVAFTEFYLPSTALVRITGIDVKRLDTGKETPSGQAVTRDVRFIYARDIHSEKIMRLEMKTRDGGGQFISNSILVL